MSSSYEAFKFPKLNGQNYATWAVHMQSALQSKYLWLVVKGTEVGPMVPSDAPAEGVTAAEHKALRKEYIIWVSRDEAAQGLMGGASEET
jgi:hypothetical protein